MTPPRDPVPRDATPPCTGKASWFFPEHGSKSKLLTEAARHLCKTCPFQQQCLEFALHNKVTDTWAGTTEDERKKIRKARKINPAPLTLSEALRPAVYRKPTVRRSGFQQCGEGWGPIRRHETAGESLCQLCRDFVNDYRRQKREASKPPRADSCALSACDVCGKEMRPKSLPKHRRVVHERAA